MNNLITCLLVVCVCVGSYYLVDSGLPIGTSFLPPHKSCSRNVKCIEESDGPIEGQYH